MYTQEEEKTHDMINQTKDLGIGDIEDFDDREDPDSRRVHTDGGPVMERNYRASGKLTSIALKSQLP